MENGNNLRAVFYMRYSSAAQNDGYSIEAQDKALTNYALSNGYNVVDKYVDRAKSGTSDNRPSFQRMISDAKDNKFDVVLVHKNDRFSRNRINACLYRGKLKKYNVQVISITEDYGENPQGILMTGINEAFAEFYSANLAAEVRKGLDIVSSQGLHTGGKPPLGYYVGEDRKLHINEPDAAIVRMIFSMYANNHTYREIINELNLKGYKTQTGSDFTAASLNVILHNRKYIGEYVYNLRESKDYQGKINSHHHKSEEEVVRIPGGVPRIIDEETYNKVATRLELNKTRTGHVRNGSGYLLTGLLKCGECGFNYQGNTRSAGRGKSSIYSSYRCGKKQGHKGGCTNTEIEKNKLENFVLTQLQKYLFTPTAIEEIAKLVEKYNASISKTKLEDIEEYKNNLKVVNTQIHNVSNAIASGASEEALIEKLNSLQNTKNQLLELIESPNTKQLPPVSTEDVKKAIGNFKEYMLSNNNIQVKAFLRTYIDKVVIYKDHVEAIFKLASSKFNKDYPKDNSGQVLAHVEISRDELNRLSKQRQRVPENVQIGKNYLVDYKVTTN